MDKKLSKKFIAIAIGALLAILTLITVIINVVNYDVVIERADGVIDILAENDGTFPQIDAEYSQDDSIYEETPFSTRYFTVNVNSNGYATNTNVSFINLVDESEAEEYGEAIISKGRTKGFIEVFRYNVVTLSDGSYMVIFIDCTHSLQLFYSFLYDTILICIIALLAFSILVFLLAKKVVFPITQSYVKQKQFITDVTHEFKTPLAIIKANNEIMELQGAENQWTESTEIQVGRLDEMISRLTYLAKIDEDKRVTSKEIDVTAVAKESIGGFYTLASANDRILKAYIAENLSYRINSIAINTLITLLLDNAIKYAIPNTKISFIVKTERNKLIIQTENSCEGLKPGKYDRWFERFYRGDESRNSKENEKNSYGIGLSTVKAIVENAKGKISATSKTGKTVKIKIELPY